jgi:hypothetical protein
MSKLIKSKSMKVAALSHKFVGVGQAYIPPKNLDKLNGLMAFLAKSPSPTL